MNANFFKYTNRLRNNQEEALLHKTMRRQSVLVLAVTLIFALSVPRAGAQSGPTGTLSGVVTDSTAAVMPGVTIKVRNVQTGLSRDLMTDESGRWTVPA